MGHSFLRRIFGGKQQNTYMLDLKGKDGRHLRVTKNVDDPLATGVKSRLADKFLGPKGDAARRTSHDDGGNVTGRALVDTGAQVVMQRAFTALRSLEDPAVMLELQGIWQQHKLNDLKKTTVSSLVALAEGQAYLRNKSKELQGSISDLDTKATLAVKHGRDDLARQAIAQKVKKERERGVLEETVAQLQPEIDNLIAAEQAYAQRVSDAAEEAELLKIRSHVADAQIRMGEATGKLALGQHSFLMDEAKDIITDKEARAGAWQSVISSGQLDQVTSDVSPSDQALNAMALDEVVDVQLAELKAKLDAQG